MAYKIMRFFHPDIVYYFITSATVNHQPFFNTDIKKDILLESFLIAQEKFNLQKLDFCLLENHHHLISLFPDNKIVPQVIKQINGRSGKLLNNYENIKNRKIWDDYHVYYVNQMDVYYKVRGYVVGNVYKHQVVKSLSELANYKYSTFKEILKSGEMTKDDAEEMVLSSVRMSESDLISEMKRIGVGVKDQGSKTPWKLFPSHL